MSRGTARDGTMELLMHNRVGLALHTLRAATADADSRADKRADNRPLLLLHGLGERSPDTTPAYADDWPGPVVALDFTGHGDSTMPVGGGYTAEMLLADADTVLAHLGTCTVVGRGLGAYIALLLAGARADHVHGAVLADGPGLSGGPSVSTSQPVFSLAPVATTPDPYALIELGRDLRPPDYATAFTRLALQGSDLAEPISVVARFRPAWLRAVAGETGVAEMESVDLALRRYV
ncbi:MAG: alpha/beta hydrolase [Ilumatobacteraceae bacterium]